MNALGLSEDWDLDVEDGRLHMLSDAPAVAQSVKANLLIQRGTWPIDLSRGVDWLGRSAKPAPLATLRAQMAQAILRTRGVTALRSLVLTSDRATRELSTVAHIEALSAPQAVAVTLGPPAPANAPNGTTRGRFPLLPPA